MTIFPPRNPNRAPAPPLTQRLRGLMDRPGARLALRVVQVAFVLGVSLYLMHRLTEIGWGRVWQSLPTQPLYYLFFIGFFFSIPLAEMLIFRLIWQRPMARRFPLFVRKRVYNLAVLSYSGDAFLALWAHRHLNLKGRSAIATVKDSAILSALASNGFTLLLLGLFFLTGQLNTLLAADGDLSFYIGIAVALTLVLVPLVVTFRGRIFSLGGRLVRTVFLIHLARLVAQLGLQVAMWWVVLPDVPVLTWLIFLTAQLVVTRIPFLPNTDLIFLGLGLSLGSYVDAPEATVAGMFLAAGALSQVFNVAAYVLTSVPDPTGYEPTPAKATR
ncbi:hypothetical protein [Yunchengibacter salinarum]|uniref:hypothetical protein n=1 Tax=Yunchengibacter salinarum TaxID=3133399 RepID=UPI0035B6A867